MNIGVPKETWPGEQRVSIIPTTVASLKKTGLHVSVEQGAGNATGFNDDEYEKNGDTITASPRDGPNFRIGNDEYIFECRDGLGLGRQQGRKYEHRRVEPDVSFPSFVKCSEEIFVLKAENR